MTLRELVWMAEGKRELEGDVAALIVSRISQAVWAPADLAKIPELNPWRIAQPESEAMRRHRESWARRKFRVLTGG